MGSEEKPVQAKPAVAKMRFRIGAELTVNRADGTSETWKFGPQTKVVEGGDFVKVEEETDGD